MLKDTGRIQTVLKLLLPCRLPGIVQIHRHLSKVGTVITVVYHCNSLSLTFVICNCKLRYLQVVIG
jgi:hypothetical protein